MSQQHPKLFHFNSTCEIAIANGSPYFNVSQLLKCFEQDLSAIMMVFASDGDCLLSERKSSVEFMQIAKQMNFPEVRFVTLSELKAMQESDMLLIFEMHSWGASPAEDFYLKELHTKGGAWRSEKLQIVERAFAMRLLAEGLQFHWRHRNLGDASHLLSNAICSEEEAEGYLQAHCPVVFKSPFSSSGRGLMVLRKPELNESNRKWIRTILDQQGYLVASLWLEKVQDFSFQFESFDGSLRFDGVSYFSTNSNGQYQSHELNRNDFEVQEGGVRIVHDDLVQIGEQVGSSLLQSDLMKYHRGKFGVDGLIYRQEGELKVHPMVEINPRYTMGAVALALQKHIHSESKGFYRMHAVGKENYRHFIEKMQQDNPPIFEGGKLKKGVISLTPCDEGAKFGAYLELTNNN
ncbi:MAG: hypothetical protein ACK5LR_06050 [Mangrovibacterium sp.]